MKLHRATFRSVCAIGLMLLATQVADASNGMNMIGFGAESVSMGGADLALTDCSAALNINPAGIAWCPQPEFVFGLAWMWPSLNHQDQLGNDRDDELDRYPMPLFGYAHPMGNLTWGVGLFVQGGMGAEYQDLTTPFAAMANSGMLPPGFFLGDSVPNFDDTRTNVMFAKLTPTLAWRIRPKWTVGATLNVGYARAEMELFPETSIMADLDQSGTEGDSPNDFFFGMDLQDTSSLNYGLRVGFQYESGALSLGGAYVTETDLDLDGGTMTLNMSSMGLGKVDYDAKMSGFAWPRQAGLGMAYQVSPRVDGLGGPVGIGPRPGDDARGELGAAAGIQPRRHADPGRQAEASLSRDRRGPHHRRLQCRQRDMDLRRRAGIRPRDREDQ
jgi:long-chain fatty acid transport protein